MSEAKNEAEVGKETTFDEKFMVEKMTSIENCCKEIGTLLTKIEACVLNINMCESRNMMMSAIGEKQNPQNGMMGIGMMGMNPMIMNPTMMGAMMAGMPPYSKYLNESIDRCRDEFLEKMNKELEKTKTKEAHPQDIDPEKIRDRLKAIDDENATMLPREDSAYVLNALSMILLTGVEVARILNKYNLPIVDADDPEKNGYARNKLMNVVAEINKIGARW